MGAIAKVVNYWQSSPTTQVIQGGEAGDPPYMFQFFAPETSSSPHSLVSASLLSGPTVLGTFGPPEYQWHQQFASVAAMDAAYPSGDYTLSITGVNDSTYSSTLSIGSVSYLSVPLVSNYNALQAIDATQPFTVNWGAVSGTQGYDFFLVQIWSAPDLGNGWLSGDVLYTAPWPGQPGATNYLSTGVTVPAGVLAPGNEYVLGVGIRHIDSIDPFSYPGVPMATFYASADYMSIQTVPEPATLSLLALGALGLFFRRKRN